jgi:translation initiation factor IF-3
LRVNREIRAPKVRLIGQDGEQIGVVALYEALAMADNAGLDLVEISPGASPPVCKIINYGKFRYDQTKREKESKKSQHQIKVKEVKIKPNIDEHDLMTKLRHAHDFISQGDKVKITCTFRGREMMHSRRGEDLVKRCCEYLSEIAQAESPAKLFGRMLSVVLSPLPKKKKEPVPVKEVAKTIPEKADAVKANAKPIEELE